jgi:hypothetical protein
MKIKRKDGKTLQFHFVPFKRGQWSVCLVSVDGMHTDNYTDPDFTSEREARRYARLIADRYEYVRGLGWCTN